MPEQRGRPAVTVVVPTYNRAASLARLLDALAGCDVPAGGVEVIVVDDGSTDGTADVVRRSKVGAHYLRQANRGPAAARNAGWRVATSPLVAFTDDDTVPDRRWLVDLATAFGTDPDLAGVGGTIRPLRLTFLTRFVQAEQHASHGVGADGQIKYLVTANCALRRPVLEALRGFDETFPTASGEDTDLTMRALRAGYRLRLVDGALVLHDHPRRLRPILRTYLKHGRSRRLVVERHPFGAWGDRPPGVVALDHWRRRYGAYRAGGLGPLASVGAIGLRVAGLVVYAAGMAQSNREARRRGERTIKVLIPCPGADHVARGYERLTRELAALLRSDPRLDVLVLKGSGRRSAHEKVLPSLCRDGAVARWVSRTLSGPRLDAGDPRRSGSSWASVLVRVARRRVAVTPYEIEAATFGVSLLCHTALCRPDVVIVQDVPTARVLGVGRALVPGWRTKVLFVNGTPWPPPYPFADVVQHVTPATWDEDPGGPWEKVLLPLGTRVPKRSSPVDALDHRVRFGVAEHEKVVISVGTMLDRHKRHLHLIGEVARLPEPRPFLVVAGAPDVDQRVIEATAEELLGDRQKVIHVAPHEVPALLSCADVFVLASVQEGFGLVYLEALASGLPTVVHDDRMRRWLLGPFGAYVDMTRPGALADCLRAVLARDDRWLLADSRRRYVEDRFSWDALRGAYLNLVRCAAGEDR